MQSAEIINPFKPVIFKLNFEFDWNILKPICEDIIVDEGARSTSQKNFAKPHNIKDFKPYYDWLKPWVDNLANIKMAFNEYQMRYYVTDSYVNVHKSNAQANEHNHACNSIVVAAYLYMPDNGGYFQAKDPLEYHKSNLPISNENIWSTLPTKTNDVLVFPSWLQHRTQPNISNEDRWVLTTNFSHKF